MSSFDLIICKSAWILPFTGWDLRLAGKAGKGSPPWGWGFGLLKVAIGDRQTKGSAWAGGQEGCREDQRGSRLCFLSRSRRIWQHRPPKVLVNLWPLWACSSLVKLVFGGWAWKLHIPASPKVLTGTTGSRHAGLYVFKPSPCFSLAGGTKEKRNEEKRKDTKCYDPSFPFVFLISLV